MRYTVRKSLVWMIGTSWLPNTTAAQCRELSPYDVENARDEDGQITRDSLDDWLAMNMGDFRTILDFSASIEDGDRTIDIPWANEGNATLYNDCMSDDELELTNDD